MVRKKLMGGYGHFGVIVTAACLGIAAYPANIARAQQMENPIMCDEATEPIAGLPLSFGAHTVGCAIDPGTDFDKFILGACVDS